MRPIARDGGERLCAWHGRLEERRQPVLEAVGSGEPASHAARVRLDLAEQAAPDATAAPGRMNDDVDFVRDRFAALSPVGFGQANERVARPGQDDVDRRVEPWRRLPLIGERRFGRSPVDLVVLVDGEEEPCGRGHVSGRVERPERHVGRRCAGR